MSFLNWTNPINHLLPQNDANGNATARDKKTLDPLFGPNIGAVTSGPAWTASVEKKIVTDDLTPDVVTSWIEKSRDASQPTTTLQALVNLKRPTIKLSPLHPEEYDDSEHSQPHGLEFEYDCDAPKCGLYVHVYLPKSHPDAPPAPPHHPYAKLLVFESVVDGGFGKHLKLDEGAVLELGHFEHLPSEAEQQQTPPPPSTVSPSNDEAAVTFQEPATATRQRRRFTALRFRRTHSSNRSISGPALAVVDAEPQPTQEGTNSTEAKKDSTKPDDDGAKVVIRLAALDSQGTELANINEQVTYLHIVRLGPKPTVAEGAEPTEDTRPWVVKVVKREATIGPHTFHLHEIYGLTSTAASKPATTTTQSPSSTHTYPPTNDTPAASECLLCLSSPREVVLLPCRHLVACKECALNMVEFGAGGNITQPEPTSASPAPAGALANGEEGGANEGVAAVPTPGGVITLTVNGARRKRKAKGWFCPVCRQPYSSLLRITTAPPTIESRELALDGDNAAGGTNRNSVMDALPTLGSLSLSGDNRSTGNNSNDTSGRSGLLGSIRPTFLRTLTGGRGAPASGGAGTASAGGGAAGQQVEMTEGGVRPVPLDVESTAGLGRAGS
ncbi:hypothetical protein FA13DRAFT_1914505 [Coprinellus micaceus]|uniref:RING-type domain-containing protein n=1 Tax=Coprinellus micaceus TaxID=71717 RepID=A0A4Y7SNR5_COPMI|nr:hypothetical protein FA13DRAFT_1914505 [Coprinellus micaceus]